MLVFDLIAGLVIVGIVLAILLVGIGHGARFQDQLEAPRDRRAVIPGRFGQRELDEALGSVVRSRQDERQAA